jgi:hypothetical protein
MWVVFAVVVLFIFIFAVASESAKSPLQRAAALHGALNAHMVCPHCSAKGQVRTKRTTLKKGVSGGKATAALLTGGISLLATGLSRKEPRTEARCDVCSNTWSF